MQLIENSELLAARDCLLNDGVVAIPTETVYGLAASINSDLAIRKIFALKNRPFFDPLIVHVSSIKQAQTLTSEWPGLADYVARTFWPGPLTLVLAKSAALNPLITSGLETVAIRYPSHPLALELIELAGSPLAAPSANQFGKTSPTTSQHVRQEFPGAGLLVVEGGASEIGLESTVVGFARSPEHGDELHILRPGAITAEMLSAALSKWSRPVKILRRESQASPGHLRQHYVPEVPLVIGKGPLAEVDWSSEAVKKLTPNHIRAANLRIKELVLDDDPSIAARLMYARLREFKKTETDVIYVHLPSEHRESGLWSAIADRLNRAGTEID